MAATPKYVQWLDETLSPLDLETCEVWTPNREDPTRPRLYRTRDDRYVLNSHSLYIEVTMRSAVACLVNWGMPLFGVLAQLAKERERADSPPSPRVPLPSIAAKDDLVILYGPFDEPRVLGTPKPALGKVRHKVIKTLIEAGDDGLSLDELRNQSTHMGARNVLTGIARKDDDWRSVIWFPGRSRVGGYRIDHPARRHSA
jgi:hypothetical protein